MKRLAVLPFITIIILLSIAAIGCQQKNESIPVPPPKSVPTANQISTSTPTEKNEVVSQDSIWDNMPLSFRKTEAEPGNESIPEQIGEWRYYHTPEALPTMRNYFASEMPNNGWDEGTWSDEVEMSLSYWTSNDGADGAMIWMIPDEPGTFIAIVIYTNQ
jgi:hypothetical protein